MRDLSEILRYVFENPSCINDCSYEGDVQEGDVSFMTVPLSEDIVEFPTFIVPSLKRDSRLRRNVQHSDEMVITLDSIGARTHYKSLDATIRKGFSTYFRQCRLMEFTDGKDVPGKYYITQGAIFKEDFTPIMMCTWETLRICGGITPPVYEFVKPILRVVPEVVVCHRDNPVYRFIFNKIMPKALSLHDVRRPMTLGSDPFKGTIYKRLPVKGIIEEIPFKVRKVGVPSVSTTNGELLGIALDNIDEIVQ